MTGGNLVPTLTLAVTTVVYVAYMTLTDRQVQTEKVTVHRRGRVYAIVASPGWTDQDWDSAVPADVQTMHPGDWNYRIVDGNEVWTINLDDLEKP